MNASQTPAPAILSGSALKLIAVVTMLIDHIAAFLSAQLPVINRELFTFSAPFISDHTITLYFIMRSIGRTAFPLFCFLLVEGFLHTKNPVRYGLALFLGALLSEIPFDIVHGALPYGRQNVFFTLLLGYIGLCIYERFRDSNLLKAVLLVALFVFAWFFKADYSVTGVAFILLLYVARTELIVIAFVGCVLLQFASFPAYILMALYNGKRGFIKGPVLKYAFYAFYPAHLLLLYLLQQVL